MIKMFIWAALAIAVLLYAADTKIGFKPFTISFGRAWSVLGYVLIGIGVACIYYQGVKQGLNEGIKGTFDYLNKEIKKNK